MNRNMSDVVKPLVELFNSNAFAPTDIIRVSAVLDSNSFRVDGLGNRGLYALGSMLNHDCRPNSRVSFDRDASLTLRYTFESSPICLAFDKYNNNNKYFFSCPILLSSSPLRGALAYQVPLSRLGLVQSMPCAPP